MNIYHGSDKIIEKPTYGAGKCNNDYGLGFYCTENNDLAMEWAVDENRNGFVNRYNFNCEGLTVLDLSKDFSILSWIAILLENRSFDVTAPIAREAKKYIIETFLPEYKKYDVIRGYRADDSYFSFARDFLNNTISLEQLTAAIRFGNLGEQIVLKSKKSFDQIVFISANEADSHIWYSKKNNRDKKARQQYFDINKNVFNKDNIYVLSILEREMKRDDLFI